MRYTLAVLLMAVVFPAAADENGYDDHDKGHNYYENLVTPNGQSCCNNNDCRSTSAKFVDGQWYAKWDGQWIPVPPSVEIPGPAPDGKAHICRNWVEDYGYDILCFIPPKNGHSS